MRRLSSVWRLAAASVGLLALAALASAQTAEVHLLNDEPLPTASPAPLGHLPVLFVHGHNEEDETSHPNYQKNWRDPNVLSFQQALLANPELGIEPYYIRFLNQDRSITEDAAEISDAIERILRRHDPNYPAHPTTVQVVIIAYSKGTLSARQYLKSLQTSVPGLPTPRPGFHPVSEFIAIAPPNHGISTLLFAATNSLAVKQLYNGFRPEVGPITAGLLGISPSHCTDSFGTPEATNYVQTLNDPEEAPGSRPDGMPTTTGTLYVTLFANGNRDFVGGLTPSTDCPVPDGRKLARNQGADAINIEVPAIAGALPPTVHHNTVHTSEVMCLALFTAANHRSPVGQICAAGSGGVPIIPLPTRAAAMLTLDFSGSMSLLACPGCATRAVVLKDAVELFVQLWSAVSVPSDRLGVTYFRTNVDQFRLASTGETMPLLSAGSADIITDVRNQGPSNSTAMGGGLQRSIEALSGVAANTPIRRVILFTDGLQNVNPMVVSVGGHHEIINQTGRSNSNVTPTNLRLDQLGGIAVDTIGIGDSAAFVGLLDEIALETNGHSLLTTAPNDDLRRFFIEQLINALRGFSPQLVAYRHGAIAAKGSTEAFAIEDGARKLVLKVSWKRGDSIDFSVTKDGVDVTSAGRFIDGEFYKIFVIDLPANGPISARGKWRLRIKGKPATAYETAAIVDGGRITYDAMFADKRPRVGVPLDLFVRSTADGKPIGGKARVTVTLMSPTTTPSDIIARNKQKELPAFEPGMSVADRQLLALTQDPKAWAALKPKQQKVVLKWTGKEGFRARFRPHVPGIYTAFVTIEGDAAKIGNFSRTLTATAVVRTREAVSKPKD